MSGRNLADYVEVKDRIAAFWKDHPEGRVLTRVVEYNPERVLLFAEVYTDREDARPAATGYAEEVRSDRGVNATSAVENGETSAIGRALANMGMTLSKNRASREEMEKVERHERQTTPRAGSAGPGREARAPRRSAAPTDRPAAAPGAAGPPSAVTPAEEARLLGRLDKVDAHYNGGAGGNGGAKPAKRAPTVAEALVAARNETLSAKARQYAAVKGLEAAVSRDEAAEVYTQLLRVVPDPEAFKAAYVERNEALKELDAVPF